MAEKITISKESEWSKLTDQSIETVVDPMVYRCGQLFLQGAKKTDERGKVWDLLDKNIFSIGTFFDSIILYEKLPVFNYADTFDSELNFGELIPQAINDKEQIFFDVDVQFEAYRRIKDTTLEELHTIYTGERKVSPKLVSDILKELSWAEYNWAPGLEYLEKEIKDKKELQLLRFLLGGLIFGKYAEKIGGEHFLQPKRSELLLKLSLNNSEMNRFNLFDKLKEFSNILQSEEIPWRPTFLPYLLSKSKDIKSLFTEVARLRKTSEVKDYRQWWKEITREWQMGKISLEKRREVETIRKAIEKKLHGPAGSQLEIKADFVAPFEGKLPISAKFDLMPFLKTIWGSAVNSLPGKRYRKLLTRLIITDNEYRNINAGIRKLWQGS